MLGMVVSMSIEEKVVMLGLLVTSAGTRCRHGEALQGLLWRGRFSDVI